MVDRRNLHQNVSREKVRLVQHRHRTGTGTGTGTGPVPVLVPIPVPRCGTSLELSKVELYERVVSLAVNRKVPEGFLIRFYRQPSPLFSLCAILFDMAPMRSLITTTLFPIFVRVCV